ncbi:MAG: endonuclease III [Candidatus Peribacteraceae bacterium]|jgi:endonuclease-3|nr:endonuclease III [Candidatus Peribacteraceae bacterium]HCI04241.1 endonuclease III [Candidatus Peribacteria bacterium]|tara:strand:+ start:11927 stop:12559 length:633 start_codon:yes stop_codon:yes gene_type:complete
MKIESVIKELDKLYDPPKSFLNWKTPLDLTVATVLSAQCTDERVNMVTKELFKKCRKAQDYIDLPQKELERIIRPCGTFRVKTKYIKGLSKIISEQHKAQIPKTMEELTGLPGVGRKTAAIILYAAFNKLEGIAVDTHVMRLSQRLGLTKNSTPEKIEKDLMKLVPKKHWGRFNTLMISHGREVCTAKNRKCRNCVFMSDCPSSEIKSEK